MSKNQALSDAAKARWARVKASQEESDMEAEQLNSIGVQTVQGVEIDPRTGEEVVRDDSSQLTYQSMAQDQWRGAIIEENWHHCIVTEPQPGLGLPSNLLKFRNMGYTFAPAPKSVRERWDEAKCWTMRIPLEIWEKTQAGYRAKAAENRDEMSNPQSADLIKVGDSMRGAKSFAELANG